MMHAARDWIDPSISPPGAAAVVRSDPLRQHVHMGQGITSQGYTCMLTYKSSCTLSLLVKKSGLGQRHGLQNITLTPCYYKNIYRKARYAYFYENIFQEKSIYIIFIFANSTI